MHSIVKSSLIAGEKAESQGCVETELLAEPPVRRLQSALASFGVSATGVRPKTTRVILSRVTLLEKKPPLPVNQEDRKGAVQ